MARMARARGPALPPWLRRLIFGLFGLYLALSAFVLWRAALLTPFSDEIDWILRWRDFQAHGDWARYLFTPVNLHRVPIIFGLLALDLKAFGGTNLPLILSGAAALAALAAMLARQAARAAPPPLALPAGALVAMLALMAGNVLDAATPICVNYLHGAALAALALILAEGGAADGLSWRRLAALLAAMAAGLGDAVALAVWPVLAICALRRRDGRWLAAVLTSGAVFLAFYAWGQGSAARGSTAGALHDPVSAVRLALNFLLLPWARLNVGVAWVGGLAVAVLSLGAILARGGRYASADERVACSFILFSLGAAAMAGLGRAWGPEAIDVPLRYAVLMAPLHAGLVILALPYAGELWRANRAAAQGLCAAVFVLAAAQNAVMALQVVRVSDHVRQVIADFHAGARTPEMHVFVHPDLDHAARAYAEMRGAGLFRRELSLKPKAATR